MAVGLKNLVPLLILFVVIGVIAVVGFVAYGIIQEVSNQTRAKMEKKHIMFNKDGLKVEVKELTDEAYRDRSQRWVTSADALLSPGSSLILFLGIGKLTCTV